MERVTLTDVEKAAERIGAVVKRTQIFTDDDFNAKYGRNFYFKGENTQVTGAFKIRGALNGFLCAKDRGGKINGLVTHSSGNHGRALAWIARLYGLDCVIVCPNTITDSKLNVIRGLGADVLFSGTSPAERQAVNDKVVEERGFLYIPTCNDFDVIAGQGTIGKEFLEQVPALDAILVPVSGGGMASGICVAAKAMKPDIKVFCIEPQGKDLEKSFQAGVPQWPDNPGTLTTVADGMRMQCIFPKPWSILKQMAEKHVLTVNDTEAITGMKYGFNHLKTVVEPSAGTAIAAAMSRDLMTMDESLRHIGVILCGGNVDLDNLPF